MKGIYALILFMSRRSKVKIGSLDFVNFRKGFYLYVGSAQNSLDARIKRHFSQNKKLRWHIDYLLKHAKIKEVWIKENAAKAEECTTARSFEVNFLSVKNFGSSDCACSSHLFYSKSERRFKKFLEKLYFTRFYYRNVLQINKVCRKVSLHRTSKTNEVIYPL